MKKSLLALVALVFISGGLFVSAPNAEASCSYNGYVHSGGKCDKSGKGGGQWKNDEDDEDEEDDDRSYRGNFYWNKPVYNSGYSADSLQRYIAELLALIERLKAVQNGGSSAVGDIRVSTQSASSVDEDGATLRALIDMGNESEGELYFEYGTSYGNLNEDSDVVSLDDSDDGDILEDTISGLNDDTVYYFRAVVEDEDGDKRYGATLSFTTNDTGSSNDDEPSVTTNTAQSIDNDSALLRGEIDMNDYENGVAFFVFGEDENQINDVESDFDTYSDVDEDGDDLRKVLVDSDIDDTETYTTTVSSLDENSDIYFALCVEYDDEDTDETLICGSVRTFVTD